MPHPPADGWPLVPEAGRMTVTPGVLAPLPGSPATSARSSAASACAAPCARARSSARRPAVRCRCAAAPQTVADQADSRRPGPGRTERPGWRLLRLGLGLPGGWLVRPAGDSQWFLHHADRALEWHALGQQLPDRGVVHVSQRVRRRRENQRQRRPGPGRSMERHDVDAPADPRPVCPGRGRRQRNPLRPVLYVIRCLHGGGLRHQARRGPHADGTSFGQLNPRCNQ